MDYLSLQKQLPSGGVKPIEVNPARIMAVLGGPVGRHHSPCFALELANKAGRLQRVLCAGNTQELTGKFNQIGLTNFLPVQWMGEPLSNLRHQTLQDSLIRIERIASIQKYPGRRSKVHSVIYRTGLPEMLVADDVSALARQILDKGYRRNEVADPHIFMLHPDHQIVPAVVPIRRTGRSGSPFTPQGSLF